jgi:type II secretory pathway pseudopilin PulG
MLMLALMMIIGIGLLGLSSIELRRSAREEHAAAARANARLALMEAIGQLQRTMGPDQRVSATAEILPGRPAQPHWTGVWSSRQADGKSWFQRDDLDGGLRDLRAGLEQGPGDRVLEWLVSGGADARTGPPARSIRLMSPAGDEAAVEVPLLEIAAPGGRKAGSYGWWTGDLGVRANLATTDPRAGLTPDPASPADGGFHRLLAAAEVDPAMMAGGVELGENDAGRLATAATAGLTALGGSWSRRHALDFTVHSSGVLADVAEGGLKGDLTAYLTGDGPVAPLRGRRGLADDDTLAGGFESDYSRHRLAGPRFGLLRDWARAAVPFRGGEVSARMPDTGAGAAAKSKALALANERPVKLAGNQRSGLQPILVEATNYTQISTFQLPTQPGRQTEYQLRHHHYPRVVLWNPYNVELESSRALIMIQGNGRQEMWTQNSHQVGNVSFTSTSQWLSFEGGRSTQFNAEGMGFFNTEGYNDPYIGSYYFSVPATKFGPGECLVFSPARSAEYNSLSPYRPGAYNLDANELSCEVAPDPARSYYVSGTDIGGGIPYKPTAFWYAPTPYWSVNGRKGVENQGDDTRAVMKEVGGASQVTFEVFDSLPQLSVLTASLQFGAGREPRISWNNYERMPVQLLDRTNPRPTVVPNVRTREGIRLRWFQEHPSNLIGSGPLAGTAHFDDALLANWNPRATYILRTPWENVAGSMPNGGSAGGPWFFGAYTRDLFDQAVSWDEQAPVPRNGRYHGNPFGPPQEGADRYIIFDLPRRETGVVSLAQFQHAKLSEFVWHPSFAVANSLADPRLGTGGYSGLHRTAAKAGSPASAAVGGFHESELGWSSDTQRSKSRNEWAVTARALLQDVPATDNLVYDLSFEANRTLWDRYFLSGGGDQDKRRFLEAPRANPLPNGRLRLAPTTAASASPERLADFHHAAYHLLVDGAFNVNSTRVEAWKALLGSSRRTGFGSGGVPFPRVLDPQGGTWTSGQAADGAGAWDGSRELNDEEIDRLARAIVDEVKLRGPFLSLADFVNRRLAEDETGRMGPLQAAIEKAGLNAAHAAAYPLDNRSKLPDYKHPDNLRDATAMEQTLKPASKAWGAPSYLTQGDVLQVIGPALAARSDTFVIRSYGDSVDESGKIQARAWCEAVVQRTPEPLLPDDSGLDPRDAGGRGDFGRRFILTSFRWLRADEI